MKIELDQEAMAKALGTYLVGCNPGYAHAKVSLTWDADAGVVGARIELHNKASDSDEQKGLA